MLAHFMRMFRYAAWADQRMLATLQGTPLAQAEALPLAAHVLAAEHVWLSRLEQRAPRLVVWPTLTLQECAAQAAENESGYRDYLARIDNEQLHTPIRFRTSAGQEYVTPAIEILTQVVTHGPYHRGQIAKIIARSGGAALNSDYITFVRESEPTA